MKTLTRRQTEVLAFIQAFAREHGRPPTIRAIGGHFGLKSTNAVVDHLRALERKGFLRRDAERACGIVVLRSEPEPAPATSTVGAAMRGVEEVLGAMRTERGNLVRAHVAALAALLPEAQPYLDAITRIAADAATQEPA